MHIIIALLAGLLFGLGLIISGMTNPARVLGFLDVAGRWNPSLAFVMLGAIVVGLVAFRWAARRDASLLGDAIRLPSAFQIDRRLVLGSAAFGMGWGLAGYCPGPAVASLAYGGSKALTFAGAMLIGMAVFELIERRKR